MDSHSAIIDAVARLFGPADLIAVALAFATMAVLTRLIEHPPAGRLSVTRLMNGHRLAWLRQIAERDVRILDGQLLSSLRQGSAFFASTCLIAIGGGAALMGQADTVMDVVADFGAPFDDETVARATPVWEAKLLAILLLMVNAFLKFVWAHRLFGYCAVLLGAMPPPGDPGLEASVARQAALHKAAARSFNRGLRTIYFALSALAWFLGPVALMAATGAVAAMLIRREFFSQSRRMLTDSSQGSDPARGQ